MKEREKFRRHLFLFYITLEAFIIILKIPYHSALYFISFENEILQKKNLIED